jgi:Holliday junction resolvase RusA-like endonuclease
MKTSEIIGVFQEAMGRVAGAALLTWNLAVKPVPASRPRVSKWGTFYLKTYESYRKEAKAAALQFPGIPTDQPVIVMLEIVAEKPRTGKLAMPRGDVDNFAKATLDVMTTAGKWWGDDDQVLGLTVIKRYAEKGEEPGTVISWAPVALTT